LLLANGCQITVLDHSPAQIDLLRRFGWKVFYGDASRLDLLHAAGAERARLLVVAIDDRDKVLEIAELARKHYPHLKILARAVDRRHAYELVRHGVDIIRRETFGSALEMGVDALKMLGVRSHRAHRAAQTFRRYDEEALRDMADAAGDDAVVIARSRQLARDLEQLLQSDEQEMVEDVDRAWDISALRKDA
jgi:voltage-gated potassium channel Kch